MRDFQGADRSPTGIMRFMKEAYDYQIP